MKKTYRILPVIICAAVVSGCFGETQAPADTTAETSAPAVSETAESTTNSAAALASEDEPVSDAKPDKPLVIAVDGLDNDYSPFSGSSDLDRLINKACGVTLLGKTRSGSTVTNGVAGVTETFGGEHYEYGGIADTVISRNEEAGITAYTFNMRSDIGFADGEILDADDVLFTLYAWLDPSMPENALTLSDIVGAANYRFNSPAAETLTDAEIKEALASADITELMREELMIPVLTAQYENVSSLYGDGTYDIYTATYPDPDDLFVFFYSNDGQLTLPEDASKNDIIEEVARTYGNNYRALAGRTSGDEHALDDSAVNLAVGYLTAQLSEDGEPENVNNITGITKTGKFSLTVTVYGDGRQLEAALCDTVIAPLHYYGDEAMFDIAKNSFGFARGEAQALADVHKGEPLGAGAYMLDGYEDGSILLKANENYCGEAPLTASVKLVAGGDAAALIADGTADIACESSSAKLNSRIDEANRSLEKIQTETYGGLGYGMVCLNTKTMSIAGDQFSEESYALRKGIATAINFYKAESVSEYFGNDTSAVDYPCVGNILIDKTAEDYMTPYSTDAAGEPIFTDEMTAKERWDALKSACLGFFEKAGYTVEDGKITAAPEGGRLTFTAEYSGVNGSHPAKTALEKAAGLLGELGITLNVNDIADAGVLHESLTSGLYDIAAFSQDGTLRSIYLDGVYRTDTEALTELVEAAEAAPQEEAAGAYYAVYDRVINTYAAEIPMYERTKCVLYSSLRVSGASVTKDMTASYNWEDELDRIAMK